VNRCRKCDAPLPINGTHCQRCQCPRDDLADQDQRRRQRDPVTTFFYWIAGTFFSFTFLLWFSACAAVGGGLGYVLYSVLEFHGALCWIVGISVTLFLYGLSWMIVIFHD